MKNATYILLLLLCGCIGQDIVDDTIQFKLKIILPTDEFNMGNSYALNYRFTNDKGDIMDANVNWISSDPSVFIVTSSGLLTPVSKGSAQLIITQKENVLISDTTNVTIYPNPKIINPINMLKVGDVYPFKYEYKNALDEIMVVDVVWNSSDESLLSINTNGIAEAKAEGTITAKVSLSNNENLFDELTIEVKSQAMFEELRILNAVSTLNLGKSVELMILYTDENGMSIVPEIKWISSNENIAIIDQSNILQSKAKGTTTIRVELVNDPTIFDQFDLEVKLALGTRFGTVASTSNYVLKGDFTLLGLEGGGVKLEFADNYKADTGLPALYAYLTNNPTTINGAYEIGPVTVFSGKHSYLIQDAAVKIETYDYVLYFCKPFVVKVGDGEIMDLE